MQRDTNGRLTRVCAWSVTTLIIIFYATAPVAAEARACATVKIDESFVMPGGSEHAPGMLRLCQGGAFSPSRALHVGYVDGDQVGMLISQRGLSEAPTDDQPFMIFARDHRGRLHLYGLALPCAEGMETFLFEGFPSRQARSFEPIRHGVESVEPT
jgi:hypothetical protein